MIQTMILHLLHTQSIVCATVKGQCLEYLRYITLPPPKKWLRNLWLTPSLKALRARAAQ